MNLQHEATLRRIAGGFLNSAYMTGRVFRDTALYSGVVLGTLAFFMADVLAEASQDQRVWVASRVILGVAFVVVLFHVFLAPKGQWLRQAMRLEPALPAEK